MTKIDCAGITIITFTDGIAEIVINPTVKPVSAGELVRLLLAHGVTAAKIIKTKGKRTPKRAPDDGQMLLSDFGFFDSTTTEDERA